jgi:hypothetical protein
MPLLIAQLVDAAIWIYSRWNDLAHFSLYHRQGYLRYLISRN